MISHKHKFILIRVPKTASTTISRTLDPYFDIRGQAIIPGTDNAYYHHRTSQYMKSHFDKMNWNFDNYFKFAFVRNPFAREVSLWKYFLKIKKEKYTVENFSDFVKLPAHDSCMQYVVDATGEKLIDYIGKTETIQQDFDIICTKIGISSKKLPHLRKTKHRHYTEYYDDETREIVAEKYAKDIEFFGYGFGE